MGERCADFLRRRLCLPFSTSCRRTRQRKCRAKRHLARGMGSRPLRQNTGGGIAGSRRPLRKIVALPSWRRSHTLHSCLGDQMKSRSKNEFRPSALPRCYLTTCARHGTPSLPAKDCGSTNRKLRLPFRPLLTQRPRGSLWTPRERPVFLTMCACWRNHRRHFIGGWNGTGEKVPYRNSSPAPSVQHVLVIDIGGGTTDFTLFEITPGSETSAAADQAGRRERSPPSRRRQYRSGHCHRIESRLPAHEPLSEVQWNFLVARCRDMKERCLSDSSSHSFIGVSPRTRIEPARADTRRSDRASRDRVDCAWTDFFPNAISMTNLPELRRD